jgi:hypothetical protein
MHVAGKNKSTRQRLSAVVVGVLLALVGAIVASPAPAYAATYPTTSSVCGPLSTFGRLCARAVEGSSGVEWDYGVFYEASTRPKISSAVMTVQMCGYGTGGSCRYLGSSYTQTFNLTSSFGRGCDYIVGGGWSFAAAGCQQNGENFDLNEGWLYKAHVVIKLIRYSDGAPFTYVADSGWISPAN